MELLFNYDRDRRAYRVLRIVDDFLVETRYFDTMNAAFHEMLLPCYDKYAIYFEVGDNDRELIRKPRKG